ncbi:hypothetical protein SUGI_0751820 [Cryptomeria japonica]|uniref:calcium uniporter protein 6, mitochondrial n=1 Tax=Cryptomeria japonica TaxID=3369 RepID=UPI002414C7CD|nr:calcium uniporter protein 6, mitochondrial [Cryptomeria japonica]GLJ37094.1 hypothetical protein SUGI_0751820 [Cryptomeria japonica]
MARFRFFRGILATAQGVLRANGGASGFCGRRLFDYSLLPALRTNILFATSAEYKQPEWERTSNGGGGGGGGIALDEVKRILRLANVEALKKRLEADGKEFITQIELLKLCRSMGVAQSDEEAEDFAKALDAAGVILIFRNKVYLHPEKVAELVMNAVPLALAPEDDHRKQELEKLQKEKEEIDRIARRHVRIVLWTGLCCLSMQTALFFRLTFWELSWDVMEPIAFFVTTGGLLLGYMYFLITSRDPSYQDVMTRLFLSKQKKLYKKRKFDVDRFLELQKHCKSPLDYKNGKEAVLGN